MKTQSDFDELLFNPTLINRRTKTGKAIEGPNLTSKASSEDRLLKALKKRWRHHCSKHPEKEEHIDLEELINNLVSVLDMAWKEKALVDEKMSDHIS